MDNISYSKSDILSHLPNTKVCNKLANFYSIFSDVTRLKILVSLLLQEMCVSELSTHLGINQTTISHQLKTLKNIGAVSATRDNKYIYYKVNNKFINNIMISGVDYILESA
jgi:ArsR family transcriptional regulator